MTMAAAAAPRTPDLAPYGDAFKAVCDRLPGGGALARRRRAALERFLELGLPGRKAEEWRYADLRPLARGVYRPAEQEGVRIEADAVESLSLAGGEGPRLVLVNGRLDRTLSRLDAIADGVVLRSLEEALASGDASVSDIGEADALVALNTAMMHGGYVIEIADGVCLDAPLEIVHITRAGAGEAMHLRNLVRLGKGAGAIILESFAGDGGGYMMDVVTGIEIADDARLAVVRRQREGRGALHLGRSFATIGSGRLEMRMIATGAASARQELRAEFAAPGGHVDFDAVQIAGADQVLDTLTHLDHAVPDCTSRQRYRGVLAAGSRAAFSGKVLVRRGAQRTDARQHAASLLLDRSAEADTKPELEIYADDVQCAHGATVGELDPARLFYLESRGLPPGEARALLIEGFISEILGDIDIGTAHAALLADARAALEREQEEGR